jgi:predicted kinase
MIEANETRNKILPIPRSALNRHELHRNPRESLGDSLEEVPNFAKYLTFTIKHLRMVTVLGGTMDKTTLSNPVVIVVVGLPGSGKSFFATQFAKTFGTAIVSEDKIRWMLFAHHTHNENENSIVGQISGMMAAELFKPRKTFVLDGGYNDRDSRATLAASARKAGYEVMTIAVQIDTPTAKSRAAHRDARKLSDRYKQPLPPREFATQAKKYQAPLRIDRTAVVISGKHTYSTQARTVLRKMLEIQGAAAPIEHQEAPTVRSRGPFVQ